MKKAVVTGGAGFIGSHLAEALAEQDYHVLILDDLSNGKLENIQNLLKRDTVEFIQESVTGLPVLQTLFRDVHYVFHQAAIASVPRSIDNPLANHETNLTGTLNVLLASRDNGIKKVVFASSAAVYGDTDMLPTHEDVFPKPLSPYAVSKLAAEYYCRVFKEVYGLSYTCLRYFNVYGPRQDPNSQYAAAIPRFIARTRGNTSPIIYGDGEQTRDFVFVKDVVAANILAAESGIDGIFNIAGGKSISINNLADLIIRLSGNNLRPTYQDALPGEIRHSLADISRARAFVYEPKWTIEEGLRETMKYT